MLLLNNSFNFNIIIHNNVINTCLNIENYINNYINENIINTNLNGLLLIKLISFSFSYPKLIPNSIIEYDKFKIFIEASFECIKFVKDMIINDLIINTNNKINNIVILTKKIKDNLFLTCIDKNNNSYNCKNFGIIQKTLFIKNNLNVIIDKFNPDSLRIIHFNSSFNKNDNFINIINNNINNSFKFNIDNKSIIFNDLIKHLLLLKKNTNYIATFNKNKITLVQDNDIIIPSELFQQYFNHFLINIYNNYQFYKI
tara:strand:+ start:2356 stop:3123 length:768 start_codon:yes stop_codon:yes gene_type:complete